MTRSTSHTDQKTMPRQQDPQLALFQTGARNSERTTRGATVAPRSATSAAAAAAIEASPERLTRKEQVYRAIRAAGIHGATRAEIVQMTGIRENTVNGRVNELLDPDDGRIVERGARDGRGVLYTVEWYREVERAAVARRAS